MTTQNNINPDEEELPSNDLSDEVQTEQTNGNSETQQNEEETLNDIAEKREEMAQSQTGFTGD